MFIQYWCIIPTHCHLLSPIMWSSFLLLMILPTVLCESHNDSLLEKPLAILMLSTPMPGHVTPVLSFAEELVRRGHHVTLCTTLMSGSKLTETKSRQVGVDLLSAGPSYFATYKEYQQVFMNAASGNMTASLKVIYIGPEASKRIGLKIDHKNITRFDLIVGTEFMAPLIACLTTKWDVYGMVISTTFQLQPVHLPPWPFPPYMAKQGAGSLCDSDEMSFVERLITLPFTTVFTVMWRLAMRSILYYDGATDCSMISSDYAALYAGVYAPQIVQTSFGFEYPRPHTPLSHYVGPLLSKNTPALPNNLQTWLDNKQNQSVILVSMGSIVALTHEHAEAIVEATTATGYSLLWSLRKSNQHILNGISLDEEQVMISEWLPQLTVVKHPAIAMAILHGGLNSVNEALYNRVPVIAIPFINDQGDVAARLHHSGAGIALQKGDFQADKLITAITSIKSGDHDIHIDRLQKMYRFAGGVDAAADLAEHYCKVGYDHLVPAYAKYKWSWVTYYNIDVYCCLFLVGSILLYLGYKVLLCCLHCIRIV